MEETLGSGFDNIRAALMSPTSLSFQMDLSPVSVHAVTRLRRPSFSSLAGVGGPFNPLPLGTFYSSVTSIESTHHDHSSSFSEETFVNSHDTRLSEALAISELSNTTLTDSAQGSESQIQIWKDFENELHAPASHDTVEEDLPAQSGSDGYESDPDDTRKFYTELESYVAVGDDNYSTDDSDYYYTDSDYEPSSAGQTLTSISRYDHRFHRYWHAEQPDLAENHFDTPLQTSKLIFKVIVLTSLIASKRKSATLRSKNSSNVGYMRRSRIALISHLAFLVRHWKPRMLRTG